MRSFPAIAPWILALSIPLIVTCSSDDGPAGPDNAAGREIAISLVTNSAGSAQRVEIRGIPDDVAGVYARVTVPGGGGSAAAGIAKTATDTDGGAAYIERTAQGDFLVTPFHPTDPKNGGEVDIEVTDGAGITSNRVRLSLDPPPAAPGEYDAAVSLLQDLLTERMRLAGTTRAELDAFQVSDLPMELFPLLLTYDTIDRPSNPNNLRKLADGDIPYFEDQPVDRDLLDSVAHMMRLRTYFETQLSVIDTITVGAIWRGDSQRSGDDDIAARSFGATACSAPPSYGITSCGDLAVAMREQSSLDYAKTSATTQVDDDATATLLALGAAPAIILAGPATVAGVMLWADGKSAEGRSNLLPGVFDDGSTDFDYDPSEFPEDFIAPGLWNHFVVTATSRGWQLDQSILEALLQLVGIVGGLDDLFKGAGVGQIDKFEEGMQGLAIGEGMNTIVGEVSNGSGIVEICHNRWENIDCTGKEFSKGSAQTGVLDVQSEQRTYTPQKTGTDLLTVETKHVFGLSEHTGLTKEVTVNKIEVVINPFQASANTSETVDFTVRVTNAINSNVRWWKDGPGSLDWDTDSATLTLPDDPWDPPIMVHARSTSVTGLRATVTASDPREDTAPVKFGDPLVFIDPSDGCIKPGQQETFTVALVPGDIESVVWSRTPAVGTLVPAGNNTALFTAPDTPVGDVNITARVNDEHEGTVTVQVDNCVCEWTGDVSGEVFNHIVGSVAYQVPTTGIFQLTRSTDSDDYVAVTITPTGGAVTSPGVFEAAGLYVHDFADIWQSNVDPTKTHGTLTVISYDPVANTFEGTFTAEIQKIKDIGPPLTYHYASITLTMRGQIWDFVSPLCE